MVNSRFVVEKHFAFWGGWVDNTKFQRQSQRGNIVQALNIPASVAIHDDSATSPARHPVYVPFLGCLIECRMHGDAEQVMQAGEQLRAVNFSTLAQDEFTAIIEAVTARASVSTAHQIRERAEKLRSWP